MFHCRCTVITWPFVHGPYSSPQYQMWCQAPLWVACRIHAVKRVFKIFVIVIPKEKLAEPHPSILLLVWQRRRSVKMRFCGTWLIHTCTLMLATHSAESYRTVAWATVEWQLVWNVSYILTWFSMLCHLMRQFDAAKPWVLTQMIMSWLGVRLLQYL